MAIETFPASWEAGRALAVTGYDEGEALSALTASPDVSFAALTGFLYGRNEGHDGYFDHFLGSDIGRVLPPGVRLAIAVRSPVSEEAAQVVRASLDVLPVTEGVNQSFIWARNVNEETAADYLRSWLPRIRDERDYQAVVQWISGWLPGHGEKVEVPATVRTQLWELVALREQHLDIGQESWEWCRIANGIVADHGADIVRLLLNGVVEGSWMIHESQPEAELLRSACRAASGDTWPVVAPLIEEGNWRLTMEIRGWLLDSFPPDTVMDWVGDSLERARRIAGLASANPAKGGLWSRLLTAFPKDSEIEASLYGDYISGSWAGPMSDRLAGKIEELRVLGKGSGSPGVKHWARTVKAALEEQRDAALEREAEGGF